jgi:hypothetical protein
MTSTLVGVWKGRTGERLLTPPERLLGLPAGAADQLLEQFALGIRVQAASTPSTTTPLQMVAHVRDLLRVDERLLGQIGGIEARISSSNARVPCWSHHRWT